jgi:Reverse transcriptase (RNA-dependent DNA polymerase)
VQVAYLHALQDTLKHTHSLIQHMVADATRVPTQDDVDEAATALTAGISAAARDTLGAKCIVPGRTKPWMTSSIAKIMSNKHFMHARWMQAPTPAHERALVLVSEQVKRAIRNGKRLWLREQSRRTNETWVSDWGSRDAWVRLKGMGPARASSGIAALRGPSGELVTSEAAKLTALQTHYQHITTPAAFQHENAQVMHLAHEHFARVETAVQDIIAVPVEGPPQQDGPITSAEVESAISKLQRYKSAGDDNIPAELLKCGGATIEVALTELFNVIWSSELAPSSWRHGVIVSLFKCGDRTDCGNYRPITLLRVIDKLYTAILGARLLKALPLHDHQFAFRPGRGTADPLFALSSTVQQRKTQGKRTYAFFLDVRKAYDTVWHPGLFYKLYHKGVRGKLWRMIRDIYSKGTACARLNGRDSAHYPILQGVAQGDPMSTILFNVHVDDLACELQNEGQTLGVLFGDADSQHLTAQLYADDMVGLSGTQQGLQRIINRVQRHSIFWRWTANTSKSHVLVFNPGGEPDVRDFASCESTTDAAEAWKWGTQPLERKHVTKYLGVMFTEDCTWAEQAAYATKKGYNAYHMWKHVLKQPYLDRRLKLKIIDTMIKPCITYGMEVWAPPGALAKKLETPLHTAVRAAMSAPNNALRRLYSTALMLNDSGIRPIHSDNAAAHVRYAHKIVHSHAALLPRSVHRSLPIDHEWNTRVSRWRREICDEDPSASLADLLGDPTSAYAASPPDSDTGDSQVPSVNHALNCALRCRDSAAYAKEVHDKQKSLLTQRALSSPVTHAPQPYIDQLDIRAQLAFRSGHILSDLPGALAEGAPRSQKRTRGSCFPTPSFTCCPDCSRVITPEHPGRAERARRDAVMLHRFTNCPARSQVNDWYHDVAVRLAPSGDLVQVIARARRAATLPPSSPQYDADVWPYLTHLLSPDLACAPDDQAQRTNMLFATARLLTVVDEQFSQLPDAAAFGPAPHFTFYTESGALAPPISLADADFWNAVLSTCDSVPPVAETQEHEAEAPSGVRRGPHRVCKRSRQA